MDNELNEEITNLRKKGKKIVELDVSDSQPFMTYHDPKTGQEFPRLPADQYHIILYVAEKGWRLGPAPEHLRAKWKAGRAERDREAQARLKAVKKTPEYKELKESVESVPRSEVEDIVKKAVQEALRLAGVIPSEPEIKNEIEETQLSLFDETVDTPAEID